MESFLLHLLNGLQLSMLIFILAVGLTLIFGLMDILNLAHGALYTMGAYCGYLVAHYTGSFWLALLIAPLGPAVVGFLLQGLVLEPLRLRGRSVHLDFALLTFGLLFVTVGTAHAIWGAQYLAIGLPDVLSGGFQLLGITYPTYRLFIIAVGILVAVTFWYVLDRTVIGAMVRAGVDNREMVEGLGINISLVFALVFAAGAALAGFAGVIAAPVVSVYSRMGVTILVITLIVVVIGGLGSYKGSFVGALIVGMVETMTAAYLPEASLFAVYFVLAAVMLVKPKGLFGDVGRAV